MRGDCVLTPSSDVTLRAGETMKYGHVRQKGLVGKHWSLSHDLTNFCWEALNKRILK